MKTASRQTRKYCPELLGLLAGRPWKYCDKLLRLLAGCPGNTVLNNEGWQLVDREITLLYYIVYCPLQPYNHSAAVHCTSQYTMYCIQPILFILLLLVVKVYSRSLGRRRGRLGRNVPDFSSLFHVLQQPETTDILLLLAAELFN